VTPTEPGWDPENEPTAGGPIATATRPVAAGSKAARPVAGGQGVAGGVLDEAPARHRDPSSPSPAEPEEREQQRRHLRLVQNQARRRAGRRRLLVVLGISGAAAVCLALVGLHVLIAENQFRLDNLQSQAATEQAQYEKLRLQVAQLEAPARIVSEAEGRLGMVQPATVTYLPALSSARPTTTGRAETRSSGYRSGHEGRTSTSIAQDPPTTGTVTAPQGDSDWPTVKPYLSGSP
jgi:cell division protein FtsL